MGGAQAAALGGGALGRCDGPLPSCPAQSCCPLAVISCPICPVPMSSGGGSLARRPAGRAGV